MTKLFVSYEIAKQLKEKGFDEACLAYYDIEKDNRLTPIPMSEDINGFHSNTNSLMIAAPIYQQVIDWFRNKHNFNISIAILRYAGFSIFDIKSQYYILERVEYKDYYEALNAAIEEALKLILK